jgi:phenylalanyl-tRNA synthetase alpha chain
MSSPEPVDLEEEMHRMRREFVAAADEARTAEDATSLRNRFTGKKAGALTGLFRRLGSVAGPDRARVGALLNELKTEVESRIEEIADRIAEGARAAAEQRDRADVTLPGRRPVRGSLHPTTLARLRIEQVFREMGYSVATGPEVEDDFHNFEALNLPKDHPARDAHDTFYLLGGRLLRTHTSPVQIRSMIAMPPPLMVIAPGRVYRCDHDVTHLPMFHQVEGLVVGEGVRFSDLKGTLARIARRLFGDDARVRWRPSYFPFVEPGAEIDISCTVCGGKGCRSCKQSGWLEILGAGMVHPAVFRAVESARVKMGQKPGTYDPERVSGFAFGMGIDRVAMLLYRVDDLRVMVDNDIRFLEQFPL